MKKGNRGQGNGRRRGRGTKKRMMGFLQPCLLVQLNKGDHHGYGLLKGLEDFIDDAHQYDPSIIYRLLRDLEANEQVVCYEGAISFGPKRKMYTITETGKQLLRTWMEDLRHSKREIDRLLNAYGDDFG